MLCFQSKNVITHAKAQKLWIPPISFPKSDTSRKIGVDYSAQLQVKKEVDGTAANLEDTDEGLVFSGAKNSLFYRRQFQMAHQCHFDLKAFPFDTQKCHIEVIIMVKHRNIILVIHGD